MKIFGWSASVKDGCWKYRLKMPLDELAHHGHQTCVGELWRNDWQDADIVIGQRIAMPAPSERWQKTTNFKIYEMDDDLLSVDPSNPGHFLFSQQEIRDNVRRNIVCADRVVVSTEHLAEMYHKLNGEIYVVGNSIPYALTNQQRKVNEQLTIGWHGSECHDMDWVGVAPHVRRFLGRNPELVFHTIGADYFRELRSTGATHSRYRHTEFTDTVEDLWAAIDFDIGLAPLRDHRFNHSKSPLKALEYGALGIPVVASAVGPYTGFVQHGYTGFLVKNDHEWSKYLYQLVTDPHLRQNMSKLARTYARQHTIEQTWPKWEEAYGARSLLPPKALNASS